VPRRCAVVALVERSFPRGGPYIMTWRCDAVPRLRVVGVVDAQIDIFSYCAIMTVRKHLDPLAAMTKV
jgi:hypothetical protein